MPAPVITVVDTRDVPVTNWDSGVVQSNQESSVLTIVIWNNRGNDTSVADLKEANISALDIDGRAISELVVNKWVQVNVPSLDNSENVWTPIGGSTVKYLRADGLNSSAGYTIKGTANDGNISSEGSTENYCTVRVKVKVPSGVSAGIRDYKLSIRAFWC